MQEKENAKNVFLPLVQPVVQKLEDTYHVVGAQTFAEVHPYYGYWMQVKE